MGPLSWSNMNLETTLVGSEHSHHCTMPALPKLASLWQKKAACPELLCHLEKSLWKECSKHWAGKLSPMCSKSCHCFIKFSYLCLLCFKPPLPPPQEKKLRRFLFGGEIKRAFIEQRYIALLLTSTINLYNLFF